jgi:hypothetical protein
MAIIILAMMAITKGNRSVQIQWTAYSRVETLSYVADINSHERRLPPTSAIGL